MVELLAATVPEKALFLKSTRPQPLSGITCAATETEPENTTSAVCFTKVFWADATTKSAGAIPAPGTLGLLEVATTTPAVMAPTKNTDNANRTMRVSGRRWRVSTPSGSAYRATTELVVGAKR